MIKFALRCSDGHEFESWFPEGSAYDAQARDGLIRCPACGGSSVSKAIMSPALALGGKAPRDAAAIRAEAPAGAYETNEVHGPAVFSATDEKVRALMGELRQRILEETVDLGDKFVEEALRMEHGEAPERAIRGQASGQDLRLLLDEGVRVLPVPRAPRDFN